MPAHSGSATACIIHGRHETLLPMFVTPAISLCVPAIGTSTISPVTSSTPMPVCSGVQVIEMPSDADRVRITISARSPWLPSLICIRVSVRIPSRARTAADSAASFFADQPLPSSRTPHTIPAAVTSGRSVSVPDRPRESACCTQYDGSRRSSKRRSSAVTPSSTCTETDRRPSHSAEALAAMTATEVAKGHVSQSAGVDHAYVPTAAGTTCTACHRRATCAIVAG
ncbi:hypothetical protein ACWFML_18945 [Bacillus altitudinis]